MAAHDLSMQLMRERDLLEVLLFKLDEQQMLLATGRNRWIHHAANEIERVIAAMPTVALSPVSYTHLTLPTILLV